MQTPDLSWWQSQATCLRCPAVACCAVSVTALAGIAVGTQVLAGSSGTHTTPEAFPQCHWGHCPILVRHRITAPRMQLREAYRFLGCHGASQGALGFAGPQDPKFQGTFHPKGSRTVIVHVTQQGSCFGATQDFTVHVSGSTWLPWKAVVPCGQRQARTQGCGGCGSRCAAGLHGTASIKWSLFPGRLLCSPLLWS